MDQVKGLVVVSSYLTEREQTELLGMIDQQMWLTDLKRRVQHYGYRYDYKARRVDAGAYLGALPEWAAVLADRLCADGHIAEVPDQLIVNEYLPGQGIASHVDCIPCFGDTILSISLGSECVMEFTEIAATRGASKCEIPVLMERGSLIVMRGQARYAWKHGIAARKTDRYEGREIVRGRRVSMTFRKIIGV